MKLRECFGHQVVQWGAVAVLIACAGTLSAATTHQGFAKVRWVEGHATVSKGGGAASKLERFMVVHPGDVVKTDNKSHVDLDLGNNNGTIQVTPGSELALDKLTFSNTGFEIIHDTQLNLRSGVLCGQVKKMAPGSKYEVKTPKGVAGIRGTRYRIAANGDVTVTEGTLVQALVMPDGTVKTITVGAGQTLVAATGDVRPATKEEINFVNQTVGDSMTHGGVGPDRDPTSTQFFRETSQEPYVSPIVPMDQ